MPNWTEQDLHVVGPKIEIDRFIGTGFVRHRPDEIDDVLDFIRLCPLKKRERKSTYTHPSGVVLSHFRTRTQAFFSMITSWDYPAEFYARLAIHWPALGFVCSVNGEMGDFGGIIVTLEGETRDLVRTYDVDYNQIVHSRQIARVLSQWSEFLASDRPYRLVPDSAWNHRAVRFDAHFDDDFWYYFRTREEMARFRSRHKSSHAMRRNNGTWNRIRLR
jgi:hypothetical protein